MDLILLLVLIPIITAGLVIFVSEKDRRKVRLIGSYLRWLESLNIYLKFDKEYSGFQFISNYRNVITLGVDGISLLLILLTTLLTPICILIGWQSITKHIKEYLVFLLVMESMIVLVFSVMDILLFYIFFESVLIPMYLIIGIWGARDQKKMAAYQFFLYTLLGSLFMLLAIIWIYINRGSTSFLILSEYITVRISEEYQIWLWLRFFASFATKVPMIPLHLWLPQAHVEAPTAGSVILAGILLKLGTYGMVRFSICLFPEASVYFTPLVYAMSLVGIIYASLTTIRQIDLKRIIAYSSVAHMNFVTIGVFTQPLQGIEGAIMLMLSHGLISSALFISIGVIYDRFHTRLLPYYGGLRTVMPIYRIIFVFFTFANISFPGTASFIGELLILVSIFQENPFVACFATIGVVLGAIYSIWLANRLLFGTTNLLLLSDNYIDITRKEFAIILPLIILTLTMGIYPMALFECIHSSVYYTLI